MFCKWCEAAKYTNIFVAVVQLNIVTSFTKQFEIDKLHIIRNMINMYWLIQYNIATYSITDLCSLIDQQLQNAQEFHISSNINVLKNLLALQAIKLTRSDYGSYTNNHTRRDFIKVIEKVIEEEICHEIHKSSV
ncbi:10259_t:CDS:2 [Cetraspora pellucida]|uniref:10259_t:CDS:1 n=1 Tax=Cetraspora pellucida TaxID=1433469 RepID=A0A9N9FSX9_9GLOM|nr:10259_t:CDS:2 [Cetraspora pellucida]